MRLGQGGPGSVESGRVSTSDAACMGVSLEWCSMLASLSLTWKPTFARFVTSDYSSDWNCFIPQCVVLLASTAGCCTALHRAWLLELGASGGFACAGSFTEAASKETQPNSAEELNNAIGTCFFEDSIGHVCNTGYGKQA